jgi:DNA-directed RNA polymerase
VVIKGKEAMAWLDKAGKDIVKWGDAPDGVISWVTPSGFLATQTYYDYEEHSVATKLFGHARIKVLVEGPEPSAARHSQGLSPNFIHSMDASHLHLTVNKMAERVPGVSLAMIHDSFGTHAADTEIMYHVLREEFVRMYTEHDPIQDFAKRYMIPNPPKKGNLDLSLVLQSRYVFS